MATPWWAGLPGYNSGNPAGAQPTAYNGRMSGYTSPYGYLPPEIRNNVAPSPTYNPNDPYANNPNARTTDVGGSGFQYQHFRPDQYMLDQLGPMGSAERWNARRDMRRQHELAQWVAAGGKPEDFQEWEQSGIDWNSFGTGQAGNQAREAERTRWYQQRIFDTLLGGGGGDTAMAKDASLGAAMPAASVNMNPLTAAIMQNQSNGSAMGPSGSTAVNMDAQIGPNGEILTRNNNNQFASAANNPIGGAPANYLPQQIRDRMAAMGGQKPPGGKQGFNAGGAPGMMQNMQNRPMQQTTPGAGKQGFKPGGGSMAMNMRGMIDPTTGAYLGNG